MCGIVGYIGAQQASGLLLDSLRRLEYRGYDSAGIAVMNGTDEVMVRRAAGKLKRLERAVRLNPVHGTYGIGHTRWATHGRPTAQNAHPHCGPRGTVAVVHNGIVENYLALKAELQKAGHAFLTETDTEVIAHLIEIHSQTSPTLEEAVRRTVREVQGVFAIAVISGGDPHKIVVARWGPPAVVGIGANEYFVASDVPAVLHHTSDVLFLEDGDLAVLTADSVRVVDFEARPVDRPVKHILWDPVQAEKGAYKHFMLKEIFEQPQAIRDTTAGRILRDSGAVDLDQANLASVDFSRVEHVRILACGTSWHAGLAGKFMIEELAQVPVEVDYGSEFRYRRAVVPANTLSIIITQSGETADTLAAQREALRLGSQTIAICNVMGSMATREASGTILTHAGPEIGVASTKAFTSQLTALFLLALSVGQARKLISPERSRALIEELVQIPAKLDAALRCGSACQDLAKKFYKASHFLFLGRGIHFPIALEGALKLKEVSYIHAEGYPAGEMKHGPNALIDEGLPVVFVATRDLSDEASRLRYEKTLGNIREVEARGGRLIAVANRSDDMIQGLVEDIMWVPDAPELLLPILEIVPLQLLAYRIALLRGCDVDQPRNLAKSVTVE